MAENLDLLELEKRRVEIDKLRAEIAEVSLAWWKRPGYLGSLGPILIAVVGFLSVWATGFFDTQRATLKSEVENLQNRAAELGRANAEVQQRIDDAYITLKLANADARYALGHLGSRPPMSDADREAIEAAVKGAPSGVSKLARDLVAKDKLADTIVLITEQELVKVEKSLEAIPASKWAAELKPLGPSVRIPALLAPDGRIYNPADRKFYASEADLPAR